MEQPRKLLLLDAYALIFRAFYAMIRNPRITSKGFDTSAVFGFVNMLQDLLKRERPTHIAVCFDPPGGTFRHEAFSDYKANRAATPEGILQAVPLIRRILDAYRIAVLQVERFEADDVIGTLATQAADKGVLTYMVTGDKDFGQLVGPLVKIYNPGKDELLGVDEVNAKYGLNDPKQVIDLLALMGDSADNIPGCPGVGPKTAEKLIGEYGSVEQLLQHTDQLKGALRKKVEDNAEQIKFSKYLATIVTDAPVTLDLARLARRAADLDALRTVFAELEFRTLTVRLIDHGEANVGLPDTAIAAPAPSAAATEAAARPIPPAPPAVGSLFDPTPEPTAATAPAPSAPPAPADIPPLTQCRLVDDGTDAAALVDELLHQPRVAVHLVSVGEEAMRGTIVGLALCATPGNAAYLPFDGLGIMLHAMAPLFAGQAQIICADVKRLMVMLHTAGVDFTAPYYDTSVAHYLLQPERGHTTAEVAADLLGHHAADPETYLGPKGRNQLKLYQVPAGVMCRPACELAHLARLLPDRLDTLLRNEGMEHLLADIEQPLVAVLARMELAGARIDVNALHEYSATLRSRVDALEQECHRLAGTPFNTASPMQVGEVLFGRLQLDPKARKTKTGQYSTTEEVLLKLRNRHPLVAKILELRGIRKLLSTYVDALPALINPLTGRLHTTYNQTVTATGRLSSANPNLQNIPVRTDDGREIRRAFIPAPGNIFFSADYSQIELRLVADLSGDPAMTEAFAADVDIHALTASRIYREPLEHVTADQRRRAKTANFGILYGISAFGLAERLDIPRNEAKQLIEGYFASFPGVRAYIDRSVEQARQQGYVTTAFGRRRMLPDINSRNAVVRSFSERNAVNAPVQGTAADIIKRAMVAIDRRMRQQQMQSKMILQVHDELCFDVVPDELNRLSALVVEEMEGAYSGRVRLTATHAAAHNWLDAH